MSLHLDPQVLDRDAPPAPPLHMQIAEYLRQTILLGEDIGPGDQLPSEREMEEALNVSRNPVRKAMDALAWEGLIERRTGIVARVAVRPPVHRMELVRYPRVQWPEGTTIRQLSADRQPATLLDAEYLGVKPGTPILRRHMLIQDPYGPLAIRRSAIPRKWPRRLVGSRYEPPLDPVEEVAQIARPARVTVVTSARMPSFQERKRLDLRITSPVWDAVRTFWDDDSTPIEVSRLICSTIRVEVHYEVSANLNGSAATES